jgi:hypothetical protein
MTCSANARPTSSKLLMRSHHKGTVIIAMIAMRVMQPAVDKIINVVAMWNGLMTTVGAMSMC